MDVYRNWEQYAVTGFKVEYLPTSTVGGNPDGSLRVSSVNSLWMFDDIDTLNTTLYTQRQIVTLEGTKMFDPKGKHVLYRNNKPLAKQMNSPW